MYKPLFYIFFYLVSISAFAQQNLVYNGDFEIYDTCPSNLSIPNDMQINYCTGWTTPTKGTSDYFNSCSNNPNQYGSVGVPSNFIGNQNSFNGTGYTGIYAYVNYLNGVEYVQGTLVTPLKSGYSYTVIFYVSLADSSEYSITTIGAFLSTNPISRNDFAPFNVDPQIKSMAGLYVNNMFGWTKIEDTFIADGGEKYITIGNFTDSTNVDSMNTYINSSTGKHSAYYYIDGVQVFEGEKKNYIPNVFTPNEDGTNDFFQVNIKVEEIVIYNRWGKEVFNGDSNSFWDGKTKEGKEVPEGVYYYIITANEGVYKGYVQLLR